MLKNKFWIILSVPLFFLACSNNNGSSSSTDTNNESAQQLGDTMASVDESGGSDGKIAMEKTFEKTFQRLAPGNLKNSFLKQLFTINEAQATPCFLTAGTWGSCSSNTITHTFNDCTILGGTYNGTVTLTWAGSGVTGCELGAADDTITRVPEFTVTGLRGATLTVSKSGTHGQVLTLTSDPLDTTKTFSFTNDGIRRVFTDGSSTLFDFTTKVTNAILVTGDSRSDRVMDGGTLEVTNNNSSLTCSYTPTAVTWNTSSCNCPESGTWTGTCSDKSTRKVEITGCGTADLTLDSESPTSVTFDRCVKI